MKKLLIAALLSMCVLAGCGSTVTTAKTVSQETITNLRINNSIKGKKKAPKKYY